MSTLFNTHTLSEVHAFLDTHALLDIHEQSYTHTLAPINKKKGTYRQAGVLASRIKTPTMTIIGRIIKKFIGGSPKNNYL